MWLENTNNPLFSLIDVGPGEGDLAFDLISAIEEINPRLLEKLQLLMVETNPGMIKRQKKRLESLSKVPIYWRSFDDLCRSPVIGIMLAHEILDALPVERLVFHNKKLFRQGITLERKNDGTYLTLAKLPLSDSLSDSLAEAKESLGLKIPPDQAPEGWSTEWHVDLNPWFRNASRALIRGPLLIIDYVLEAKRYYNSVRKTGTLMAYKKQCASKEVFFEPGYWDLTSHLCLETLMFNAGQNGWKYMGHVRQGQALLALGLSQTLYSLQKLPKSKLTLALRSREALLRLVDPAGLGEFYWLGFEINNQINSSKSSLDLYNQFLEDPIS